MFFFLSVTDLRSGVHGGVSGGTVGDAGAVVDDVLMTVLLLLLLFLLQLLALVVQLLAVAEGDAAPVLEGVVARRAARHAGALVHQVPAGDAGAGVARLRAAAQALVVAALVAERAGVVLACRGTHCRRQEKEDIEIECLSD